MTVNKEQSAIGECGVCGINVYDRNGKNKLFKTPMGETKKGYPRDVAMPCGINRIGQEKSGDPVVREMTKDQFTRCPFETKEQQSQIEYKKGVGVISGSNTWDGIV